MSTYLRQIAEYITITSGFSEDNAQIAALAYDNYADSSQAVLHWLKLPLYRQGWVSPKSVNKFGNSLTVAKQGRKQIIFVDEFVGSGKTVISRMEYFAKNVDPTIKTQCDIKFCFIAGMQAGISRIRNFGFDVFCPLIMEKGISDIPFTTDWHERIEIMKKIEEKLAATIAGFDLATYSFGYGKAEALYSLESRDMNTPNSVFPVFWWPRSRDGRVRHTLLTRAEHGLK